MRVKVIMMPLKEIQCISIDDTIGNAMKIIDEYHLLSMPVVDGKLFIGVLSKQHTYETYFKEYNCSKDEFLNLKVKEMMKSKIQTISKDMPIEEAAALFISSKVRFIPVTNEKGELEGIITQQAIFKQYQKLFGTKYNSLTILCHDYKGALAKIAEVIEHAHGNIKNIVQVDTEVMGLQEVYIRIDAEDFSKVIKSLEKNKFDVRNIRFSDGTHGEK
ncbi:CBS domain-containing protein [Velocimicrobium porci]|uniref:CBS domain-containing protein n=1 Tax=Velocimicrobium porci TaxID=2606634 RepID=A0A6L5Y0F4_9FIRM|nr:CBS domain-containing protein [Velocimicrobium porci]MSS64349.1 CBS domain-containing protein [Velocimicrobium porci]